MDGIVFIYVYNGSVNILDKQINKNHLAVLTQEGELKLHSKEEEARFLLVAGEPLNEPVARGGPFVMNTKGEVLQAFSDYQEGKFA
jgi:redox-sensitive bicupin YhaK (pirin superfamily)